MWLLILMVLFGCVDNDYGLVSLPPQTVEPQHPDNGLQLLFVLDNSCSMSNDWSAINVSMHWLHEDMSDVYEDRWVAYLTSASREDELMEAFMPHDTREEVADKWQRFHEDASMKEQGMAAAIDKIPAFGLAPDVIVILSDEHEQSTVTIEEYHQAIGHAYSSMVTPPPHADDCADRPAVKYHEASDQWTDICTLDTWSVLDWFPH